jgi:hypothetical protein
MNVAQIPEIWTTYWFLFKKFKGSYNMEEEI